MKTKYFFLAALAGMTLASCSDDVFVGDLSPNGVQETTGAINFNFRLPNMTRANEFVGATAAEKLGRMFVVEGTKGSEQETSPSTTVVFDNYLVGYEANSAGRTEDNTNNWEYVGLESGITGKLSGDTWTALHPTGTVTAQTIKYWDYSQTQYDFIAWSTGEREAVTTTPTSGTSVKVTRINNGAGLATNGFTMTALSANDLLQCYYTDIITAKKVNGSSTDYGKPVTLTFRNMAAKVRVALYETVPGYSVTDVKFYSAESDKDGTTDYDPEDLGTGSSADNAVLFTTGGELIPQSGEVLVFYPRIGSNNSDAVDYNKASVTVNPVTGGADGVSTQTFGALTAQYSTAQANEAYGKLVGGAKLTADQATAVNTALSLTGTAAYATDGSAEISATDADAYNATLPTDIYLGRTLPEATFAGSAADNYFKAVMPNTAGVPLTLRVDYTLVPIDGAAEIIKVYGAKAVVPASYTKWLPNYAYTYIFKISDNSNGWTSTDSSDPAGLFPITFDAVVSSFTDANAEQTTVTTVATPSITTYQQGHVHTLNPSTTKDEYSKSQKAGADQTNVKDLYVQVMDNSGATPTLKTDLKGTGTEEGKKSLLFLVSKDNASEAEVMDALENRTNEHNDDSPVGRNGITLTKNANIANNVTSIVNGVDDQPITVGEGTAAKIDIDKLDAGTYAYVYCTTVPTEDEAIYNVAAATAENYTDYYAVALTGTETPLTSGTAAAGKVYFVKNVDATGEFVSYTFKQTKVGDDVTGLVEADLPQAKASGGFVSTNFYFDVYNRNNGEYAVKVIKVVE